MWWCVRSARIHTNALSRLLVGKLHILFTHKLKMAGCIVHIQAAQKQRIAMLWWKSCAQPHANRSDKGSENDALARIKPGNEKVRANEPARTDGNATAELSLRLNKIRFSWYCVRHFRFIMVGEFCIIAVCLCCSCCVFGLWQKSHDRKWNNFNKHCRWATCILDSMADGIKIASNGLTNGNCSIIIKPTQNNINGYH